MALIDDIKDLAQFTNGDYHDMMRIREALLLLANGSGGSGFEEFEVTFNRSQILGAYGINTLQISKEDLGLAENESYKIISDLTEFHLDLDGSAFNGNYTIFAMGDSYANQPLLGYGATVTNMFDMTLMNINPSTPYSFKGKAIPGGTGFTTLQSSNIKDGMAGFSDTFQLPTFQLILPQSGGEIIGEIVAPGGMGVNASLRVKIFYTKFQPLY
jgi:hypothetical protein